MDEEDAIYEAARELAEEGRILCFDEVSLRGASGCEMLIARSFK
jgi:predicted ATPase